MKIKMPIYVTLSLMPILNNFENVKGRLGYNIHRTKYSLQEEIDIFIEERDKLLAQYGEQDEKGRYYIDENNENFETYKNEIDAIGNEIIEIELRQVPKDVFDATDIYSETASTKDYDVLRQLFIESNQNDDDNDTK